MSVEQIEEITSERLLKIRDQFYAGKAAIDEKELQQLCREFDEEIQNISRNDLFSKDPQLLQFWHNLIDAAFTGQIAKEMMQALNPNTYYRFGMYLLDKMNTTDTAVSSPLQELTHDYLDLFRLSQFLTKIYDDKHWESLVHDLIDKSNYTVSVMFKQRVGRYKDKTLFKVLHGNNEVDYKWQQVEVLVESYSQSLLFMLSAQSVETQRHVAFLMDNSLQMALLDIACLSSGIVNIMIPGNSVPQHVAFILNQTKAPLVLISDEKQLAKIKMVKSELQYLQKAVLINGSSSEDWVYSHKEFVTAGVESPNLNMKKAQEPLQMDSLATIMYTSGTTGEPKGIMFSQMNIVYKRFCRAMALPQIGDQDRFLAYLPLYHTFGRWLEMMGSIFWGATYAFMENPAVDTMITNMQLFKPTVFISIPKKWLQLYEEIANRVDIEFDDEGLILQTVRQVSGGKLKWGLSAAGFLPSEVFQFFQKYGIELLSGFGMTEATGGITMTPPGKYQPNSLGKALPGIEIKLAEDGELFIRGKYVMSGYFDRKQEETFTKNGWFGTGDIMRMNEEAFIEIIDRKKEIYKNSKGETIAPQKIENYFRDFEDVKQVFLVGDHRPFNTVLIYANHDAENSALTKMNDFQKQEYFSSIIVTVNKFLAPFERIVDFRIIDRPFSANKGELTSKGTFKRRVIEKNFDDVIETMYNKNYISLPLKDKEVHIPNWFLREKGCLSGDIITFQNGLSIPKLQLKLTIEKSKKEDNIYRIGDYYYRIEGKAIDFQTLLTNPLYWMGNRELFDFIGEGCVLWFRQEKLDPRISYHSRVKGRLINEQDRGKMQKILSTGEQSLFGLHYMAYLLQSVLSKDGMLAIQYLRSIIDDETLLIYKMAVDFLFRPNLTDILSIRREMFKIALRVIKNNEFQNLLELYLQHNYELLDEQVINTIVEMSRGDENLDLIENVIQGQLECLDRHSYLEQSSIPMLFKLLTNYGMRHPTSYERARRIIVRYQLNKERSELKQLADQARYQLSAGFRNWLGANQTVAVDIENGEEYGWQDVIILEEGMDEGDRDRIVLALSQTSLLREAIFLFSGGTQIRLNDILPGGVWVSQLRNYHDKSVYRVSIQTRFQGSFDIVLNLNKNRKIEDVREEINWQILAGSRFFFQELVEDFGGYWDEFDLWSSKFVPGDSVAKFLQRESRKKDETTERRLYYLWPFFVWNAAASYFNFWKLTGYKLQLADPSPGNFIVPSHDYQTRTRVVSFSERIESSTMIAFFENFYQKFIKETEEKYPFFRRESIWNYVFSGVINAEGEKRGIEFLRHYLGELKQSTQNKHHKNRTEKLQSFLHNIEQNGFIPKQLFFAIKRFHRWFELNKDASLSAQAETLYNLFETYHLPELERNYPETRTRFFLETAFRESSQKLRQAILKIVLKQHEQHLSKDETLEMISQIQSEFKLNGKEDFFLTRLSYPHLKPTDSAALLKMKTEGAQTADLVVQLEDYDGNSFVIRRPVSPREISRLHQLFIEANLLVHFRPEHQFLVVLSERGYSIGGLFYTQVDNETVYMDKIVVSDRYRRKGISEGLMNEFFNRLRDKSIKFVTTGFFRPEYFYRFGFKIERKYSGLVKEL